MSEGVAERGEEKGKGEEVGGVCPAGEGEEGEGGVADGAAEGEAEPWGGSEEWGGEAGGSGAFGFEEEEEGGKTAAEDANEGLGGRRGGHVSFK